MTEQELLEDCLRRLNQSSIEYMLVGSMASNDWGIPRSTHDIDFVVSRGAVPAQVDMTKFESLQQKQTHRQLDGIDGKEEGCNR